MLRMKKASCLVFDFANTISSVSFFQTQPKQSPNWKNLFDEHIFADKSILTSWCRGQLSYYDIAGKIGNYVEMTRDEIIQEMKQGCANLSFNEEVMKYAKLQRSKGRKTALVTVNMDIFTEAVVPAHNLDKEFDVIVNSADFKTDNKLELWPIAFESLGTSIDLKCSLLIDDSEKWVKHFRENQGEAYMYTNDYEFVKWQCENEYL